MMKKNDYRTEFEEQRQEVDINNGEIPSRVDLHRKGRKLKERKRPKLINILLGLFTLIPVGILIFVVFSWNSPKEKPMEGAEDSQFQFETSGKSPDKVDGAAEEDDEKNKEEIAKEEAAKKEQEEQAEEEAKKAQEEQAKQAEEEAAKKAQEEQARKAQEEAARKAQAKKAEEEAAKKAQEEQAKKEEQPASRTHTVAAGETLYRISVTYYKSGDGVSKIMQANGLSSNEISTGQKLVIP